MSSTLTQLALTGCFLAVTSKGLEGRMIVSFDAIKTIESTSASCNYGVAINLKNGQKICVIDSIEKIGKSLATQKSCEG
ncbi:MAG: hypothetical protein EOP10_11445 [Proteobacteria bacterium]|nr:MAG: hypothetical protein EOP10_27585 [Pseudomonadota bacterium]RZA23917.1 MAG: hypothetical protein EOP10_11445 [Pseudomonadota bacterium]